MENVPWDGMDGTARIAFPMGRRVVEKLPELTELSLSETVDE